MIENVILFSFAGLVFVAFVFVAYVFYMMIKEEFLDD